jgi:hypothetical protein
MSKKILILQKKSWFLIFKYCAEKKDACTTI